MTQSTNALAPCSYCKGTGMADASGFGDEEPCEECGGSGRRATPPKASAPAPESQGVFAVGSAAWCWQRLDDVAKRVDNADVQDNIREFLMRAWHHEVLPYLQAGRASIAADAQDAKRYRWLRDSNACGDFSIGVYDHAWANNRTWLCDDNLDAAIDAAIAATPQEQPR